jgi:integrase
MASAKDGSGSLYQRGNVWWVKVYIGGKAHRETSKTATAEGTYEDAKRLRDKLLGQKHRGEISGGHPDRVTVGELLDDVLEYATTNIRPSTEYIWRLVIEKNIRPFFATLKAQKVTTEKLKEYRRKRISEGRSDATANRELSILRTAFHNGRKCTPAKVLSVPYFPMTPETNIRTGFLSDEQYASLLKELPSELKPLFAVGYATGIRLGELKAIRWDQMDLAEGNITLENGETKNGEGRLVPILDGEMSELLTAAKKDRDENWPDSPWVFNRQGEPIKDFRWAWEEACKRAGVPDLKFHDLRRTAVRNMRRDGVPQVVRMKISGHKTDSMERRYNIVDADDIKIAKSLMQAGRQKRNV